MNRKKTFLLMGIIIALAFGVFWHIWNIFAGEIPVVRTLTMMPASEGEESGTVWTLPFGISHSWSMFLAPLFFLTFAWFSSKTKNEADAEGLAVGLIIGLAAGMMSGLIIGLASGLFIGLASGLFIGLAVGMISEPLGGLVRGLYCTVGYGLGFGFVCGIFWTMPLGAVFGMTVTLPALVILVIFMVTLMGTREAIRSLKGEPSDKPSETDPPELKEEPSTTDLAVTAQPADC